MDRFSEHFESARRHFGVALIDLNYAAADLARCMASPSVDAEGRATVDLLNKEIARLRHLSAMIERVASDAADIGTPDCVAQHWPDLARSAANAR